MEVAHIDREVYVKLAVREFTSIRVNSPKVGIYTVVRACVKAAGLYSQQVSHLYRGGIRELVVTALADVLHRLCTDRCIDDESYRELLVQYERDKQSPLPEVVTEWMHFQGFSSPARVRK